MIGQEIEIEMHNLLTSRAIDGGLALAASFRGGTTSAIDIKTASALSYQIEQVLLLLLRKVVVEGRCHDTSRSEDEEVVEREREAEYSLKSWF